MNKQRELDSLGNAQVGLGLGRRKVLQSTGLGVAALGVAAVLDTPRRRRTSPKLGTRRSPGRQTCVA